MQAVVKKPRIRLGSEIPEELLAYLQDHKGFKAACQSERISVKAAVMYFVESMIASSGSVITTIKKEAKKLYTDIEVIEDEELEDVFESDWYKNIKAETTPGDNLKIYREIHGFTQEQMGRKLGKIPRQGISNMENGHRSISKKIAKRLANLFDVSVEKFI